MTVDPRLATALERARTEYPDKSDTALLKELALRGARSDFASGSALERILTIPGVRLPTRKLETVLPRLDEARKLDIATIDRILKEDRADREIL